MYLYIQDSSSLNVWGPPIKYYKYKITIIIIRIIMLIMIRMPKQVYNSIHISMDLGVPPRKS